VIQNRVAILPMQVCHVPARDLPYNSHSTHQAITKSNLVGCCTVILSWRNHPAHTAHKNRFGRKVRQMIYNYIQRYPELRDVPLESPTDLSDVAEVVEEYSHRIF